MPDPEALEEIEQLVRSRLAEDPSVSLRELRERLGEVDSSLLSVAILSLVNRGVLELTPDRKLHEVA